MCAIVQLVSAPLKVVTVMVNNTHHLSLGAHHQISGEGWAFFLCRIFFGSFGTANS